MSDFGSDFNIDFGPAGAPTNIAPPTEGALPVDNYQTLIVNALEDAGIVGIGQDVEPTVLQRAARQCNWILAQWARKRWLTYRIQDYSFVTTGAQAYAVGKGGVINMSPRPDRLEYAFLRFLQQVPSGGTPVDIPIDIIQSHEDYSRITVKSIGTFPWRIFYDPLWPMGLLFPWPVPQASIYEIHVGFKVILPRFGSITQPLNFPPEYEAALNDCLIIRLKKSYQFPVTEDDRAAARNSLNAIRLANTAVGNLQMPRALRGRNRAYDYRGDTDDF